jgi:ankyrin repeat protein
MEVNKLLFDTIKQQKFNDFMNILKNDVTIDVNIRDSSNTYLIQYAIMYNNIDIINILLNMNCKVDFIDIEGHTILYNPIKYGYNNIIKTLLDNDNVLGIPLVDIVDKFGSLPIHYTIQFDNLDAFNIILEKSRYLNKLDDKGYSPLHLAIKKKNYQMIKTLVNNDNVNVNITTHIGESPLHLACNYEDVSIIEILLTIKPNNRFKINLNIVDNEFQITPLMYVVTLNNKDIVKILLSNGANTDIQDALGNTALHLAINENNVEIANLLIAKMSQLNLLDINGMSPFHLLIYIHKDVAKIQKYNVDQLITNTNLNIQDMDGNTIWHIFAKTGLWYPFTNLLKYKKNNLFIKNSNNETPFDILKKTKYFNEVINIIIDSYYNLLLLKKHEYITPWENNCANKTFDVNECKKYIKTNILNNNVSVPMKKSSYCEIEISEGSKTIFTTFTGVPIDILAGLSLLNRNNKNMVSTLNNNNLIVNDDLQKYYANLGIIKNNVDFLNFEIIWLFQDIFYPIGLKELLNQFKSSDKRFFIIPLGIELDSGAHANIIIIDKEFNSIERFEPNGSDVPPNFNYNANLLDNTLYIYFKEHFPNFIYLKPTDFLPKIGFQSLENVEYYKTRKLGDPGGFCAVWCIWYANNRIKYKEINPKKLVSLLINKIKYNNFSFKNIVRNFSKEITDYRDGILIMIDMDINHYLNNQYNLDDLKRIEQLIKNN